MNSRHILNLGLFIVIIILVSIVLLEPGKEPVPKASVLTSIKPGSINHIYIQSQANKQYIELKKINHKWIMLQPYSLPANPYRIDSVLKILNTETHSQHDLSTLKPADFGLDKPRAVIKVTDEQAKQTEIIFGHNKSLKNHRYLQVNNTLHMMVDKFHYLISGKTESFIDHKLIPEGELTRLDLPDFSLNLENEKWQISKDNIRNYSADNVTRLLDEWKLSQAYDLEKINAKKLKRDISLHFANDTIIYFEIISSDNDFILLRHDNLLKYILSSDRKKALLAFHDEQNKTDNQ